LRDLVQRILDDCGERRAECHNRRMHDFWTGSNAPWWLSVVTLIVGLLGAHFTTKYADQRRFDAEDRRQKAQRRADRHQYMTNRVLDEVGLLLAAAEEFRVSVVSAAYAIKRDETDRLDVADAEAMAEYKATLNSAESDGRMHRLRAQTFRAEMVCDGELAKAIANLRTRGRKFYVNAIGPLDKLDKHHDRFSSAIFEVQRAACTKVLGGSESDADV